MNLERWMKGLDGIGIHTVTSGCVDKRGDGYIKGNWMIHWVLLEERVHRSGV